MSQNDATSYYQIGGSLATNSPSYVIRKADLELEIALYAGEFCYVLNSRQMGKSSLRVRVMSRLQARGIVCIFVDLTGMGTQNLSPEKWYAGIIYALVRSSQLKIDWRKWWRENKEFSTPIQLLGLFIEEVLLVSINKKIVIFIDEIDRVLSQKFSLDDFFALIHSCYQKRQVNSNYERITFALLGVAAPRDLIRNKNQSPFNLGKAIDIRGFTLEECKPLILGLKQQFSEPQAIVADILSWTGGQPFLTQKLCQLAVETKEQKNKLTIADLVEQYIIYEWENKDEPEHLRTIRDRLFYRNSEATIRLLSLYRDILQGCRIRVNRSSEQIELRLSGLVVAREGILEVNNQIYARIFDLAWIEQQLQQLRPYNVKLQKWLETNCSDSSYLLTGRELQNTLTWSLGKSLADIDYQFLVASQDLAKQEIKNTLETIETANQLLANARKNARQKAERQRLSKKVLSLITLGVTGSILILRTIGILQSWEWSLLDRFFCWRPNNNIDPHIVVIRIDERDIRNIGQVPIPDAVFASAINNLKSLEPNAIALDIYRDLPVPPGNRKLRQLINNTPNLYLVEKIIGDSVAPPPNIASERIGFADRILDSDGRVRRDLLSLTEENGKVRFSLGTKLALHYLQDKQIELQPLKRDRYRLGKAIFKRFTTNSGGYVNADAGGYQILFNYWGTEANFAQYSLMEVLNNRLSQQNIRDKIIFIGATAESIKDIFYTPYSQSWFRSPKQMPGVFIHANTASQIINAAINNRPLLNTYNLTVEYLLILIWGAIGVIIGWRLKAVLAIASILIVAVFSTILLYYLAFIFGWWLPLVPALLALIFAIVIVQIIQNRHRDRKIFYYTLKLLTISSQTNPLATRIALEYFMRSENKDNSQIIKNEIKKIADNYATSININNQKKAI